ncbi:MAG: transcriptional repressor AgaR [Bryobacteraceae bacterium]
MNGTIGSESRLLAEERRREIVQRIDQQGRVTVAALAKRFGVSAVTIRSDLDVLSGRRLLVRSHGGAILPLDARDEFPISVKRSIHHAEKVRIGRAAADLVRPHQIVILDSGTTTPEVAASLRKRGIEAVTVITHALNVALELAESPNLSLIMIGGVLRRVSRSFVGPQAERMMRELHADHFFLAVDGLDPEAGLSTPDILEAQLNALMMTRSREVTVVADASKIGRRSVSVIADIHAVHRIITDDRISAESLHALRAKGVDVIVV